MSQTTTLVFVPGAWHKPTCYTKIIKLLEEDHHLKCVSITLPSTTNNPNATFKDDIDVARDAILAETTQGRNVVVIAHSYGGMVGNSAIKGLTAPATSEPSAKITNTPSDSDQRPSDIEPSQSPSNTTPSPKPKPGYVTSLILLASGFTLTGVSFMDPLLGNPPPFWRIDKPTGYAILTADTNSLFYHDLPPDEATYWSSRLTTQSLKSLFEGGEHAYAGWRDVPTWYVGTTEDRGLPVVVQRVQVGMARGMGGTIRHVELQSSHSPFLSRPGEVVEIIAEAVREVSGGGGEGDKPVDNGAERFKGLQRDSAVPMVRLLAPGSWVRYGMPFLIGRAIGVGIVGFTYLRKLWTRK